MVRACILEALSGQAGCGGVFLIPERETAPGLCSVSPGEQRAVTDGAARQISALLWNTFRVSLNLEVIVALCSARESYRHAPLDNPGASLVASTLRMAIGPSLVAAGGHSLRSGPFSWQCGGTAKSPMVEVRWSADDSADRSFDLTLGFSRLHSSDRRIFPALAFDFHKLAGAPDWPWGGALLNGLSQFCSEALEDGEIPVAHGAGELDELLHRWFPE